MNQFNDELKNTLHGSLSEKARLTQSEKEQIMERVRVLDKRSVRKQDVVPSMLTVIAAAGFLFFAGGLAAKEFGYLESHTGKDIHAQLAKDPYSTLKEGDFFKGWELVEKGPSQWVFKGYAKLAGTLVYESDGSAAEKGELFFIPDIESAKLLPTTHGGVRKLTFEGTGAETVSKLFGMSDDSTAEKVEIEISAYTAPQAAHEVDTGIIQFKKALNLDEPARTFTPRKITLGTNGKLELSEELNNVYNQFSSTHDDASLAGLEPFSIFMLYTYAGQQHDFQTRYALHDTSTESPFSSVDEYVVESEKTLSKEGYLKNLKTVRDAGIVKEEVRSDGTAVIWISDSEGLAFSMTRGENGIWKMNWLPIQ